MKRLVLVSAALLAFTVLSAPASAQTVKATPQAEPIESPDPDHLNIELSCTALATPNALWTYVDACYLQGTGAPGGRYNATTTGGVPGPVDAGAGVKLLVPAQTYKVCVAAHGYFPGALTVSTGTICI